MSKTPLRPMRRRQRLPPRALALPTPQQLLPPRWSRWPPLLRPQRAHRRPSPSPRRSLHPRAAGRRPSQQGRLLLTNPSRSQGQLRQPRRPRMEDHRSRSSGLEPSRYRARQPRAAERAGTGVAWPARRRQSRRPRASRSRRVLQSGRCRRRRLVRPDRQPRAKLRCLPKELWLPHPRRGRLPRRSGQRSRRLPQRLRGSRQRRRRRRSPPERPSGRQPRRLWPQSGGKRASVWLRPGAYDDGKTIVWQLVSSKLHTLSDLTPWSSVPESPAQVVFASSTAQVRCSTQR